MGGHCFHLTLALPWASRLYVLPAVGTSETAVLLMQGFALSKGKIWCTANVSEFTGNNPQEPTLRKLYATK